MLPEPLDQIHIGRVRRQPDDDDPVYDEISSRRGHPMTDNTNDTFDVLVELAFGVKISTKAKLVWRKGNNVGSP